MRYLNHFILILFLSSANCKICAQDNYEIQVYASQTQSKGYTMFELHSNYTFSGEKNTVNEVWPSHHELHETVEITTGITKIFEIGVYLFTAYVPGHGYQIAGTHLRPRIMVPAEWELPVGLSLSSEIGYQRAEFSTSTWNIEVRPIIDKQWNKWYASLNPTLGISLHSKYEKSTPVFEPNLKVYYNVWENNAFGIEYYGDMGYINRLESFSKQGDAVFITYDLLNNSKWELNIGAGIGITSSTDPFVFKLITGRRIKWHR